MKIFLKLFLTILILIIIFSFNRQGNELTDKLISKIVMLAHWTLVEEQQHFSCDMSYYLIEHEKTKDLVTDMNRREENEKHHSTILQIPHHLRLN